MVVKWWESFTLIPLMGKGLTRREMISIKYFDVKLGSTTTWTLFPSWKDRVLTSLSSWVSQTSSRNRKSPPIRKPLKTKPLQILEKSYEVTFNTTFECIWSIFVFCYYNFLFVHVSKPKNIKIKHQKV